jgi:hypothetical protein
MISSPEDRKKVVGAIKELSDSMLRVDAEKDLQKDIVQATFEDTGVDKKHIRKLAVIYHKQSMNDVKSEFEDVEALYEELFK